jgi:hypothetical protein
LKGEKGVGGGRRGDSPHFLERAIFEEKMTLAIGFDGL